MPGPRQLDRKMIPADETIRRYADTLASSSPDTTIFVGAVTKAEIKRLMTGSASLPENEAFQSTIDFISEKAEVITAAVSTTLELQNKVRAGTALTPDERQLGKTVLAGVKLDLKTLYSNVAESSLAITQIEQDLTNQKRELENKQTFGRDLSAEIAAIDTRLKNIASQKAVLEEFFKAFRGEDLNFAVKLAAMIHQAQEGEKARDEKEKARLLEIEKQQGIKTAFESLLHQNGIPVIRLQKERKEKIDRGTPEDIAWQEYYSQLGRFFISLLLDMVEDKQSFQYLDMGGNISQLKFSVFDEVARLGPAEVVEKATLKRLSEDLKLSEVEIKAANKMSAEITTQLFALGVVLDKDDEYLSINKETGAVSGKAQTFEGIMQMFPAGGTSLNPWMWNSLFSVGNLYWKDDKGNWHEDDVAFGKKMYTAFREILIRGRNVDRTTLEQHMYSDPLGKEDLHKADVLAARLMDKDGDWQQFKIRTRSTPFNKPVVPIKQAIPGKSKDKRMSNFYAVVNDLTSRSISNREPDRGPDESDVDFYTRVGAAPYRKEGYHLDEHATTLAVKLSNITGETDFQDSTRGEFDKDGKPGKPEGVTLFSQLMNLLRQIRKYTEEQKVASDGGVADQAAPEQTVGKINEAIIMERAMWAFLDYFGYDGKTYTKHIIENEDPSKIVWGEVTQEKIDELGLDQNTLGQGMHPKEAQQFFGTMVNHFLPVVKQMWEASFDLRSLMKINYETGVIEQVNVEKIDAMIDSLRKILDYFSYTESSYGPSVVQQKKPPAIVSTTPEAIAMEKERNEKEKIRNPTGDMITITVRSSKDRTKEVTFVTRIHQIFPMHPMHLWRWLPTELRDAQARALPGQEAKYYIEEYPDTNHGKRAKKSWVIEVPVDNMTDLPDPKLLLARENVYRFIYALIYQGNQKSKMDVSDWAVLMSVLTDKGYQKMEEGWWDGPIYYEMRKIARKLLGWMENVVEKRFGKTHARWLKTSEQFLSKEIGSFKHRAIYPWEMGWQLISALNDKLTLEEFGRVQSGLEEFFSAKRGKH